MLVSLSTGNIEEPKAFISDQKNSLCLPENIIRSPWETKVLLNEFMPREWRNLLWISTHLCQRETLYCRTGRISDRLKDLPLFSSFRGDRPPVRPSIRSGVRSSDFVLWEDPSPEGLTGPHPFFIQGVFELVSRNKMDTLHSQRGRHIDMGLHVIDKKNL